MIVLTDGLSSNRQDTQLESTKLREMDNVTVIAVGIGSSVDHEELLEIASRPRMVFSLHNKDALHDILENSMTGCKGKLF